MEIMLHGGDIENYRQAYGWSREEMADFSANINPLGPPSSVLQRLHDDLGIIADYPDPESRELRQWLAAHWGIAEDCVCVGNGAAELIFLVMRLLRPRRLLTVAPTFREYEQAAQLEGADIVRLPLLLEENAQFPLSSFLPSMAQADLVVLAQPNNPTGRCLAAEELQQVLSAAERHGVYVLLDEAFLDFLPDERERSLIPLVMKKQRLIVLRSLTKFYALPGLRIGYVCASPALSQQIRQRQAPWSVNSLAQSAALTALQDETFRRQTLQWLENERSFLQQALREKGYRVYPGEANFLLVYHPLFQIEREWVRLAEQGIFIRDCRSFALLDGHFFRIAVRTRRENERLLAALPQME